MINPLLRRAVLAASALAALSLPSAAQTDAAFASALGKIPSGLATMAQLKTQSQAPAQVLGPTAPADVWQKVFKNALRYGKREPVPNTPGFSYFAVDQANTPKGTQLTLGLTFLVAPAGNGNVKAVAAQFTYIEISYDANTKQSTVISSVFETDGTGRLKRAFHQTDVEKSETDKIKGTPVNLDLGAPDTKLEFDGFLDYWSKD